MTFSFKMYKIFLIYFLKRKRFTLCHAGKVCEQLLQESPTTHDIPLHFVKSSTIYKGALPISNNSKFDEIVGLLESLVTRFSIDDDCRACSPCTVANTVCSFLTCYSEPSTNMRTDQFLYRRISAKGHRPT